MEQYIIEAKLFLVRGREIFTTKTLTNPKQGYNLPEESYKFNFRIQMKDIGLLNFILYYNLHKDSVCKVTLLVKTLKFIVLAIILGLVVCGRGLRGRDCWGEAAGRGCPARQELFPDAPLCNINFHLPRTLPSTHTHWDTPKMCLFPPECTLL